MPRSESTNRFEEYDPQSAMIRDAPSLSRSVAPQRTIGEQREEMAQREAERTGTYQAPEEKVDFLDLYQSSAAKDDLHELTDEVVHRVINMQKDDIKCQSSY